MTVLVLAQDRDPSADLMVRALGDRGVDVFRLDTAWFPTGLTVRARLDGGRWIGTLETAHRAVDLEELRSIWYRSPAAFRFPPALNNAERQHAHIEAKLGLGGVLCSLPVLFVNHPGRIADAAYKPVQLTVAAKCGLTVPRTLICNQAAAAREFVSTSTGTVTKMLGSNSLLEPDGRTVAFTRPVGRDDLDDLRGIEVTTHLFQCQVPKAHDVRLVVVGERQFGFAIHAGSAAGRMDFRSDYAALRYEPIPVPTAVADAVTRLMRRLGLVFAAIDFVVTPAGDWVFIGDVNPSGQYGWLEANTGVGLTDAIADLLARGLPAP